MIAAILPWHGHHDRAFAEVDRRLGRDEPMVLAGPAVIEAYSVLTSLPGSRRLSAADAFGFLRDSFLDVGEVVALDASAYMSLVASAVSGPILGGAIYDAVIAACAVAAHVDALLTFNERHFLRFASASLDIVVPSI